MKKVTLLFSVGIGFVVGAPTGAYELTTHAALTGEAYERMLVADPDWLTRLGLGTSTLSDFYYDVSGAQIEQRMQQTFERGQMPRNIQGRALDIKGWLMRGAIREDDLAEWAGGENPQDDPYGNITRVFNHFYDAANDRPLTIQGVAAGDTASNWAFGSTNAFASPPPPNPTRRNHFSILDAREALYRAATGKTTEGGDAGPGNTPATEAVRNAYWATIFRALGNVLHLTQDMAQPQHTRNDLHAGRVPVGPGSQYELLMECSAEGGTRGISSGNVPCDPLPFSNAYPIPELSRYSDYFSTREGLNGRGLGDYSNRGFFSAGTSLGSGEAGEFPAPSNNVGNYTFTPVTLAQVEPYSYYGNQVPIAVLSGTVQDRFTGVNDTNVSLATLSAWRDPLSATGWATDAYGYTVSRHNYKAMAKLLIPRAVAYSTGLMKHFFRAELGISLPSAGVYGILDQSDFLNIDPPSNTRGFHDIKLKLRKVKPANETMTGTLQAAVTFHRNLCYLDDLRGHPEFVDPHLVKEGGCRSNEEEILLSDPMDNITVGDTDQELHFYFLNALPINATDVMLRVVFRGTLGNEQDAVVVSAKNLSEPSFYMTLNSLDYIHVGTSVYTREQINADAGLLSQIQPTACVVNGQLSNTCFTDTTMSSTLTINGGVQVQINLPGPKRFSRIAYLGDAGATVQLYQSGKCPYIGTDKAMQWDNQFYPILGTMRELAYWGASNCVFNGDLASPMIYDRAVMGPIVPPDTTTPVPVTIVGFPN